MAAVRPVQAGGAGLAPGIALALALAVPAVVLFLAAPHAPQLVCTRDAFAVGEPWRWLTGHWVHASADHLCWDVGAFAVLGALCGHASRARFLGCVLLAALAIPAALWLVRPELDSYCGLSGIDSALFGLLVGALLRRAAAERSVSVIVLTSLLATGFAAKVAYETCTSQTLFVDSSPLAEVPEPLAHAVGFAIGLAVASVGTIGQRPPSRPSVGHRNPPPESP